jgi:hypothetical protein
MIFKVKMLTRSLDSSLGLLRHEELLSLKHIYKSLDLLRSYAFSTKALAQNLNLICFRCPDFIDLTRIDGLKAQITVYSLKVQSFQILV